MVKIDFKKNIYLITAITLSVAAYFIMQAFIFTQKAGADEGCEKDFESQVSACRELCKDNLDNVCISSCLEKNKESFRDCLNQGSAEVVSNNYLCDKMYLKCAGACTGVYFKCGGACLPDTARQGECIDACATEYLYNCKRKPDVEAVQAPLPSDNPPQQGTGDLPDQKDKNPINNQKKLAVSGNESSVCEYPITDKLQNKTLFADAPQSAENSIFVSGTEKTVSSLCTAEEADSAKKAAEQAEVMLFELDEKKQKLKIKVIDLESAVRMRQSEIRDLKDAIKNTEFGDLKIQYQNELRENEEQLPQVQKNLEEAKLSFRSAESEAVNAAESYKILLADALRCMNQSQERALSESKEALRLASESEAQKAAEEIKARRDKLEKTLQRKEYDSKADIFLRKKKAGIMPSSVRLPMCGADFVEQCAAGEVRKEASYICAYPSIDQSKDPKFFVSSGMSNKEFGIPAEHMRKLRAIFGIAIAYKNYNKVAGAIKVGSIGQAALPAAADIGNPADIFFDNATFDALDLADPALTATQYLSDNIKLLMGMTMFVRIEKYEVIESYKCKDGGDCWLADWEKNKPVYTLAETYYDDVEFVCQGFASAKDRADTLDLQLGNSWGNSCKLPNVRSELPAILVQHSYRALYQAMRQNNLEPNDSRCLAEPPKQ